MSISVKFTYRNIEILDDILAFRCQELAIGYPLPGTWIDSVIRYLRCKTYAYGAIYYGIIIKYQTNYRFDSIYIFLLADAHYIRQYIHYEFIFIESIYKCGYFCFIVSQLGFSSGPKLNYAAFRSSGSVSPSVVSLKFCNLNIAVIYAGGVFGWIPQHIRAKRKFIVIFVEDGSL